MLANVAVNRLPCKLPLGQHVLIHRDGPRLNGGLRIRAARCWRLRCFLRAVALFRIGAFHHVRACCRV